MKYVDSFNTKQTRRSREDDMEKAKRIKPVRWTAHILLPIVLLSILFSFIGLVFGEWTFRFVLAGLLATAALIELITLLRTRNPVYFIPLIFYTTDALVFYLPPTIHPAATIIIASTALISFILLMIVLFTRKLKWRYREVLEMAARSVTQTADGFTDRPYPAGKQEYTEEEIRGFAKFLLKYAIAYPIIESDRIVLLIPENMFLYIMGFRRGYENGSYIAFDFQGSVSVKIAQKDYRKYNDELTFDRLCGSFAALFIEFLNAYRTGEARLIVRKMNDLKFVA